MWILFFVQVLLTSASGQPYFISYESSSSSSAASLCKLAAPPIQFTQDGQEVDLTNTNIGAIPENMWVGYVMTNTTFVYKGCARVDSEKDLTSTFGIRADPGHCYSFCNTQYIGLARRLKNDKTACYCLENLPSHLLGTFCTVACSFPMNTLCGNVYNLNMYVSVYEKVSEPHTQPTVFTDDIDRQCLALEPYAQFLFWSSCSRLYRRTCQNEYGDVSNVVNSGAAWQTRMQECLANGYFPVDPRTNLSSIQNEGGQLWIGAIRSHSISTLSDSIANDGMFLQGYIDTNLKLQFSNRTSSLQLHSLCTVSIPTSSSASSTRGTEMRTQPSSTSSSRISQPTAPPVSGTTTKPSTTPVSGGSKAAQSDDSNGGIIALYIVVPFVALAITVAVGVLIWRRRRQTTKENADAPYYINGVQQTEPDTTYANDVDLNPYERSHHVDNTEHQYSALDHRIKNATVSYTNVDHTYTNEQNSSENVYVNK